MYLSDDQGEYVPKAGVQNFSIQGLSDALMLSQGWHEKFAAILTR